MDTRVPAIELAAEIINTYLIERNDGGSSRYRVKLQRILFETFMTDEEVLQAAKLAFAIMKELEHINQTFGRKEFDAAEEKYATEDYTVRVIHIFNSFATDEIHTIIQQACQLRRVGGAYALLISTPPLKSAIYAVYDRMVDNFEDTKAYAWAAHFLTRSIMYMRSKDVK